jgi:hypothetical protein
MIYESEMEKNDAFIFLLSSNDFFLFAPYQKIKVKEGDKMYIT